MMMRNFFAVAGDVDLVCSVASSSFGKGAKGDDTPRGILQYSLYSMYSMYYIISRQAKEQTQWH